MPSQGQTPPTAKARVVLQPLKLQKSEGSSPKTPEKQEQDSIAVKEGKISKEEMRPIPDIKAQASEVEKKVLTFCLDPSKKINKDQTVTIMRYFKDMRGIVEELLLQNSYLAGRLEERTGKDQNKETEILTAVNKSLQVSKRLETAVRKTTQPEQKQPTYARKVRMTCKKVKQKAVKPPRNVVIIHPEGEGGNIKSSEDARDAVFTLVNPRKKGIQVTAIRKIKGNGLVVETTKPEGLKAFIENDKLKEAGLKTITPHRRSPRLIMYDVPRDLPEKELVNCIRKQNQDRLNEEDIAQYYLIS